MTESYTKFCYYLSKSKGLARSEWSVLPGEKKTEMIEEAKRLAERVRLEISWSRGKARL